jgi:hypothetical protein
LFLKQTQNHPTLPIQGGFCLQLYEVGYSYCVKTEYEKDKVFYKTLSSAETTGVNLFLTFTVEILP